MKAADTALKEPFPLGLSVSMNPSCVPSTTVSINDDCGDTEKNDTEPRMTLKQLPCGSISDDHPSKKSYSNALSRLPQRQTLSAEENKNSNSNSAHQVDSTDISANVANSQEKSNKVQAIMLVTKRGLLE